ncbi:hypothetical protein EYF80_043229 [Liparis tanakae]|uniref:Uncharacterized protein n=1 Tax=Liparis tanakae TaxID=230148 RepID=A0A4Z2G0D0_9TELE|nr:hypothetical protein EYF80_043229 [Liparis tanakae]
MPRPLPSPAQHLSNQKRARWRMTEYLKDLGGSCDSIERSACRLGEERGGEERRRQESEVKISTVYPFMSTHPDPQTPKGPQDPQGTTRPPRDHKTPQDPQGTTRDHEVRQKT